MDGTYTTNNDDRILLRPPSTVGTQTNFNDPQRAAELELGIDNPLAVETETTLQNGHVNEQNGGTSDGKARAMSNGNGHIADSDALPPKENDTDEDDNPQCGWFRWRPQCLQCCNNIVGYTLFLSIFVIAQGMTVNGLVYVVITTLERRFGFTSVRSGFISSSYDFSVMVIIIFVTYFGEKAHKPVWLGIGAFIFGIGSIIFTFPHFLSGEYEYQDADFEMCDTNRTSNDICTTIEVQDESLVNFYGVFILAQVFHGIGASPLYTLGVTYIDENVSSANSGLYIGVFKSMAILGPAIGYIVGGLFLGLYTELQAADELDISPSDPTWVGAWWLGFIVAALISFSIVIPFLGYSRSLPGGKAIFAQRVVETQKGTEFEAKSGWKSIMQFPKALWTLLKNPPFMFNNLSTAMETFILVAVGVFGPKFMESQFNMTAGEAAIIAGIIVTPSSFIGALFGGWVVKHFNLKYRGMMRFTLGVLLCSFAFQFVFLISCANVDFAGVTVNYGRDPTDITPEEGSNVTATCNGDCMCTNNFQPVCGEDDVMYYSPCHAGCTVKTYNEESISLYSDCDCIPHTNTTAGIAGKGTGGRCEQGCSSQLTFILLTFALITVTSMIAVPQLTATLRCVSQSQRTFALGVQSVIYRCLGSIPAPIIFGSLIDRTCLIWEDECDGSRNCWMYDNAELSRYTLIMLQCVKGVSIISIILALVTYRPAKESNEETDPPNTISQDVMPEIPRVEDDRLDEKV
ncbi:solute carrier organic anion transporter family member 4A1-like isoform X2 [Lytechinus pictus]|uniref:solute carrier organic anion transporter family member 4A1-like isoform X2 n=1 Tax=Lytechinus pictus TaxID=7653 RepID=UPI00240E07BE|nr:solute carrier organic anion transporter family member 4A1-like [Lytechinus pictus]